ncbi:hypothetical protein F0L68_13460 [Solihabitans fulvus]|uniref:Uncharacterized protein n=1 Tax=Solihabitans fulvus TaxID=1892852 RepID=A0A5B2XGJ9_9PSEU|nr:hypothetical protein [Solihabitans fulvus]KAA2262284.1 hypothetical protein F0L68_13460 [Solihabitans fulvus]
MADDRLFGPDGTQGLPPLAVFPDPTAGMLTSVDQAEEHYLGSALAGPLGAPVTAQPGPLPSGIRPPQRSPARRAATRRPTARSAPAAPHPPYAPAEVAPAREWGLSQRSVSQSPAAFAQSHQSPAMQGPTARAPKAAAQATEWPVSQSPSAFAQAVTPGRRRSSGLPGCLIALIVLGLALFGPIRQLIEWVIHQIR